jgi:sulfate transport system permease protein
VSFGSALIAASIASVFGFITAWVLVRYSFFGKNIFHALIDLPFALPTAVAGIVLATIFQPSGFLGKLLLDTFETIHILYFLVIVKMKLFDQRYHI